MNKLQLIYLLATRFTDMEQKDIELAVKKLIDEMVNTLCDDGRIEIRGFGSFSLHHRDKQERRNPKTGEKVIVESTSFPHFKAGKDLRDRVNNSYQNGVVLKEDNEVK